jgi:hypothetical protein
MQSPSARYALLGNQPSHFVHAFFVRLVMSQHCYATQSFQTCQTTRILKSDSRAVRSLVVGRGFDAEHVRALLVVVESAG